MACWRIWSGVLGRGVDDDYSKRGPKDNDYSKEGPKGDDDCSKGPKGKNDYSKKGPKGNDDYLKKGPKKPKKPSYPWDNPKLRGPKWGGHGDYSDSEDDHKPKKSSYP